MVTLRPRASSAAHPAQGNNHSEEGETAHAPEVDNFVLIERTISRKSPQPPTSDDDSISAVSSPTLSESSSPEIPSTNHPITVHEENVIALDHSTQEPPSSTILSASHIVQSAPTDSVQNSASPDTGTHDDHLHNPAEIPVPQTLPPDDNVVLPAVADAVAAQAAVAGVPAPPPGTDAVAANVQNDYEAALALVQLAMEGIPPLVTQETRSYIQEEWVAPLNDIATTLDFPCYSLETLPVDRLRWVPPVLGAGDLSDKAHLNGRPVIVWILAEVIYAKFLENGRPTKKPTLLVRPLVDSHLAIGNRVIEENSQPHLDKPDSVDGLWVSRWQGTQQTPPERLEPFLEVYDATNKIIGRKSDMTRLECHKIKRDDLVVVEALIHRWPLLQTKDERTDFWKRKNWRNWRAEFHLNAIYLLHDSAEVQQYN